jgi:hypothetical protein
MSTIDKILRDIETLRESIKLDNEEIAKFHFSGEQLQGVLTHIGWCMTELSGLKERLEEELKKEARNADRS